MSKNILLELKHSIHDFKLKEITSKMDVYSVLSSLFPHFTITKGRDGGLLFKNEHGESLYIFADFLQDVNNEPYNKRLQGEIIKTAIALKAPLFGIYPVVLKDNTDYIFSWYFVKWDICDIKELNNKTNPALKVDLYRLFNLMNTSFTETRKLKYHSTILSRTMFLSFLKDNVL